MFGGFKFYGSPKETLVSILAKPFDFPLNATATELSFEQWLALYYSFRRKDGYKLVSRAVMSE